MGSCPSGNLFWWGMSKWEVVLVGGELSWWGVVLVGSCPGGELSQWEFVLVGNVQVELSRWEVVLVGNHRNGELSVWDLSSRELSNGESVS